MSRWRLNRCLGSLLILALTASFSFAQATATAEKTEQDTSAAKPDAEKPKDKKLEKFNLATITIKGSLPEGNSPLAAFGVDDANLLGMVKRIRKAAEDDKVDHLVLKLRSPAVGRGTLNEVRSAISAVRKSGKQVWADLEMGTPGDYLIACSCDQIIMPEGGFMVLPGTRAEVMFYRNLFDLLAIEPDFLQMGDFKGAGEPYMRSSMSEEFRSQLETVLSDFHEQMIEHIAEARDLPKEKVAEIVDEGLMSATRAKELGLIDRVAYPQDWEADVCDDDHELKLVEDYAKKKIDTDFSGMGGIVKMMELLSGGKSGSRKSRGNKVAIVYAVGAITSGSSAQSLMGGVTMGSDTIVEALDEAANDDKVAAIVLRVNSPGGSALASDMIWNKINQIEKPVICSMGDVAASGGYYIAMGCDKIYAEPGTLTGSIGVISGKLALGKMMRRFGLNVDVISYGENSGIFTANDKFSDSERKAMRSMMEETYEQFTSKAAEGRDMPLDDLKKLAGGRVWSGRQAKDNGLVDELGTLRDAIAAAQTMAKLDNEEEPELIILPEVKSFIEQLLEGDSVAAPNIRQTINVMPTEVRAAAAEMSILQRLSSERMLLLTPIRIPVN